MGNHNHPGSHNYEDLLRHVGHRVVVTYYGDKDDPANVAVECETCCEVLLDYDRRIGPIQLAWAEPTCYHGLAVFIDLVQTLIIREPADQVLALTWHVTDHGDHAIYEAHLERPDSGRPDWRVLCALQRSHRRSRLIERALRLWINGFRRVSGIFERDQYEMLRELRWYFQNVSG